MILDIKEGSCAALCRRSSQITTRFSFYSDVRYRGKILAAILRMLSSVVKIFSLIYVDELNNAIHRLATILVDNLSIFFKNIMQIYLCKYVMSSVCSEAPQLSDVAVVAVCNPPSTCLQFSSACSWWFAVSTHGPVALWLEGVHACPLITTSLVQAYPRLMRPNRPKHVSWWLHVSSFWNYISTSITYALYLCQHFLDC